MVSARSRISQIAKKNPKLGKKLAEKNQKYLVKNANVEKKMKS